MRQLIYLEWLDAVQQEGESRGENPAPTLFKGYTTLIGDSEDGIVVAQFLTDDGGYFDRLAIPRQAIVKVGYVFGVRKGGP